MVQLEFMLQDAIRKEFIPPAGSLTLGTTNVEVKRIRKEHILTVFCQKHHYLHKGEQLKKLFFSRAYGLYLGGELAGVTVFNVPGSSSVEKSLYPEYEYQKGTLALSRMCCDPQAPFNSESFLLARSLRLLEQDNYERVKEDKPIYKTVITYADYGLLHHTGTAYRSINAWYAGTTEKKSAAAFHNPLTGQIISARQGSRTLTKDNAPDGFIPMESSQKFKYLFFLGDAKKQLDTMRHLRKEVQFRSRLDDFYIWQEGRILRPSHVRAYDEVYTIAGRKMNHDTDCLSESICL